MKTIILGAILSISIQVYSQDEFALKMWNDVQNVGIESQTFRDTCTMTELRIGLQNDVSSIEVGSGFRVEFYAHEDLDGLYSFAVDGPVTISDLSRVPMNGLRQNWDDAIGSFRIIQPTQLEPGLAFQN